jgi:hypothetical protein
MKPRAKAILGVVLTIVAAIAVVVLLPAPDPLRNARTVYIDTGAAQGGRGAIELEEGLNFVLNDRELTLVFSRSEADVELRIQDVSVNLGNVTVSLSQGGISGRVKAVCRATNLRTSKKYTMDLTVTVDNDMVSAKLVSRKFWEFWK